ncbi:MAG TPA: ATP-binding protein [Candidatus Angelobacter sp.]|nr:ATP-binding protein [Candidatus Angelobacter sp.]
MTEQNPDLRILVLARIGRDTELLCAALHRHGFTCTPVSSQDDIFHELKLGAGAAIVTEESLNGAAENWGRQLQAQPPWSDLPVIMLTGAGGSRFTARSPLYRSYSSITLLERPVRSEVLLSAVEAALRARMRQYEVRDYMNRQAESQDALRRTEKLAVAGRMAASIAHEINNPLAAITNLLYLVSTSQDLETVKKYTAIAQDELRRVSDIANQTLRFYRAPKPPEQVKVSEVADSALALFRSKMRTQNIKVHRDYAEHAEITISLGELRQVLVNLIANAIDALPNGGNLRLRTSSVRNSRDRRKGVSISVADDGQGISPDARKRLFSPFFTTKGTTGTGLGLWLTRDILEHQRGYIRCRNHHSPHGAVFIIWLPMSPPADVATPPVEARAS